jgi:CRP-like cAMP-binding protein
MASFRLLSDHLEQMVRKKRKMKTAIPFPKLKKYLADLVQVEERLDYKAGQTIFYEGHYPYGVYVLRKGRIRLFTKKENEVEELLKIVEPPQILGEEAFAENKSFGYSAKAETDVSISFFSRASMQAEKGRKYEVKDE